MNNLVYNRLMYIFLFLAQFNSKLPTSIGCNQAATATNKLILKNYSNSGKIISYVTNTIILFNTLITIICIIICIGSRH